MALIQKWSVAVDNNQLSVVKSGDKIYTVGGDSFNDIGQVYGFNATTGEQDFKLTKTFEMNKIIDSGSDLFVSSADEYGTYRVNYDGSGFTKKVSNYGGSGIVYLDDYIYAGYHEYLRKYSLSFSVQWTLTLPDLISPRGVFDARNGFIYIGIDGKVYKIDTSGAIVWSKDTGDAQIIGLTVNSQNEIYAIGYQSSDSMSKLYKMNSSGTIVATFSKSIFEHNNYIGLDDDENVYLTSNNTSYGKTDYYLRKLDSSLNIVFTEKLSKYAGSFTVDGEDLYIAQSDYVTKFEIPSIPSGTAIGSIVMGGTTSRKLLASRTASGSIVMGGMAAIQRTVSVIGTGSIVMGGTTTSLRTTYTTTTGSIVMGGTTSAIRQVLTTTTGSIVMDGTTTRRLIALRTASGNIVMSGETRAIIVRDAEALQGKRYLYKVYDEDGSYIETWKDVVSEVNWTHEINTIGSTTTIELGRNSDSVGVVTGNLQTEAGTDLLTEDNLPLLVATESKNQVGPGSSVEYNNRVDIMAYYGAVSPLLTEGNERLTTEDDEDLLADIGAPNGRRVFTGFISEINSRYGNSETTVVQLTSYGFDLDQYPITTAWNNNVTTVPFNSYDPSTIITTGIDRFVQTAEVEQTSYTHRTPLSVALSGTVVSYTFRSNTYKELLDKTLELLPANWYYRVGLGDNVVYVQERSATPHHLFYLGKHIKALDLKGSILDVKNRVLFTGGGEPALYKERTDAPAPRTRRGLSQMSDNRVTVPLSAEIIADGAIDEKNKVQYRTTVEILTEQYDIESISVGESVGFRNFGNYVDELVFQIVGSTYTGDTLQLQLETKPPTINSRLEDIRRNMTVNENQNLPTTPS